MSNTVTFFKRTAVLAVMICILGLATVFAQAAEPEYSEMSYDQLQSLYQEQAAALTPRVQKFRQDSQAFREWQRAVPLAIPVVARGEAARRQLMKLQAEEKDLGAALPPEFKVDPKDGDVVGHPLIDGVAKSLFQKTLQEAAKEVPESATVGRELRNILHRLEAAEAVAEPQNYQNPYEAGSRAAISLERGMGEAIMLLAVMTGKKFQPLPVGLEHELSAANQLHEAMKRKTAGELPERIDPVDTLLEQLMEAARK